MNVFKAHLRSGGGELHICKIPEAGNTQIDQMVGSFLRDLLGNRQHDDINGVRLYISVQLIHGIDVYAVDNRTDDLWADVKRSLGGKSGLREVKVLQQGAAEIANTDHNEMMIAVHTQNMADFRSQLIDIVSVSLLSELTEATEILPNLRRGNVHLCSQRVGGDSDNTAVAQLGQLPVVPGQPPNNGI